MSVLRSSELCRDFEPEEIMAFEALASRREVADGEAVLEQGSPNGSLFIIEEGQLRVERQRDDQALPVATLESGETFGEMSFLDRSPASASVRARGPASLIELSHEMLEELLEDHPRLWGKVWRNLAAVLKGRLLHSNELLERHANLSSIDPEDPSLRGSGNRG